MPRRRPSDDDLTPAGRLDEGPMHDLLGYQLAQASLVTTRCFVQAAGTPLELRPVEYTILQLVCNNDAVTPTRLAKALALTAPGVTQWLDRLEQRGLIARERSATDRRAQHLSATRSGRELAARAVQAVLAAEAATLDGLSPGERQILLELLHKVARQRHA